MYRYTQLFFSSLIPSFISFIECEVEVVKPSSEVKEGERITLS